MGVHRIHGRLRVSVVSALLALGLVSSASGALPTGASRPPMLIKAAGRAEAIPGFRANRVVAPASLYAALAKIFVPSFSRQTGLACSACHYQFPQLTPFGRMFKLNGYTLTGLPTIPALAAMVVTGLTQTSRAHPGAQNGTVSFPQQLSIFPAGQIPPHVGIF